MMPWSVSQAYNGLVLKAQLEKCESVLVIGGQSTVGQAAIAVALSVGCTVYTSVSYTHLDVYKRQVFLNVDVNRLIIHFIF